jgi:hypothetical protein
MSDINYEEDQRKSLDLINESSKLSDQVVKLTNLEDELADKETELKELKRKVELVSGEVIPTMMQEMNISTLKLADGTSVEVKPIYGASILVAKREEAFKWLRDNGLGDLIKNDVTVTFGMSEDIRASDYASLAKRQGYEPIQKVSVHTGTLKALVRERIESGKEIPTELFNVFAGNQTKVKRNK